MYKYLTFIIMSLSVHANADCIGSGSLKTCYDASGNSYTVNKLGNSTYVNGYNSQTGSSWNQSSTKLGTSTYTNGNASNGNSWNSTSTRIGNSTYTSGLDSDGNPFSSVCNQFGCN